MFERMGTPNEHDLTNLEHERSLLPPLIDERMLTTQSE
jgi:hypothetical protein